MQGQGMSLGREFSYIFYILLLKFVGKHIGFFLYLFVCLNVFTAKKQFPFIGILIECFTTAVFQMIV